MGTKKAEPRMVKQTNDERPRSRSDLNANAPIFSVLNANAPIYSTLNASAPAFKLKPTPKKNHLNRDAPVFKPASSASPPKIKSKFVFALEADWEKVWGGNDTTESPMSPSSYMNLLRSVSG